MNKRVLFLGVSGLTPRSFEVLVDEIAKRKASKTSNGFIIRKRRKEYIEARFSQRVISDVPSADPVTGDELTLEVERFLSTEFRLSRQFPQLEVYNPPRGIATFRRAIISSLPSGSSLNDVLIDINRVLDEQFYEGVGSMACSRVKFTGFPITDSIFASMDVAGVDDVRAELRDEYPEYFEYISIAKLKFKSFSLELLSNGKATFFGDESSLREHFSGIRRMVANVSSTK